jgi:ABC-2 type transport system permease protein
MSGFQTLFYKELLRFWKVSFQTVLAPVVTALLYLTIFGHALSGHVQVYPGVGYTSFLVPGLVMMSVLQNAFANSSSSLIQSKITGNLVFVLLPPIAHWEMFFAYVLASVVRGLCVGFGVFIVTIWFIPMSFSAPFYIIAFAILGSGILGTLGLIAGIWADKFDQLAAFQNFLIMPLRRESAGESRHRRRIPGRAGADRRAIARERLQAASLIQGDFHVADSGAGEGLHRWRLVLPASRSGRRRPALFRDHRERCVRRQAADRASSTGLCGARRAHARGDSCAEHEDPYPRRVEIGLSPPGEANQVTRLNLRNTGITGRQRQ